MKLLPPFCWPLLLLPFLGISQSSSRHQIGVLLDNDLYASLKNDRYYTNGITLFYGYLNAKTTEELLKKTTEFRLGQYIYTPKTRLANKIEVNDRPFAGYLFGEVNQTFFMASDAVYQTTLQIGYVGPNSLAQQMQNGLHNALSLRHVEGWQNQIKNIFALQTQFRYTKKLLSDKPSPRFDIHFQTQAMLGTIQTSMNAGFFTRFSLQNLLPLVRSNFYDSGVLGTSKASEIYLFVHPSIQYQGYDATIQGSLFGSKSPVELDLIRWRFHTAAGIKYHFNQFSAHYTFYYRSKEVDHPVNVGYYYGSIGLSYILK